MILSKVRQSRQGRWKRRGKQSRGAELSSDEAGGWKTKAETLVGSTGTTKTGVLSEQCNKKFWKGLVDTAELHIMKQTG